MKLWYGVVCCAALSSVELAGVEWSWAVVGVTLSDV